MECQPRCSKNEGTFVLWMNIPRYSDHENISPNIDLHSLHPPSYQILCSYKTKSWDGVLLRSPETKCKVKEQQ